MEAGKSRVAKKKMVTRVQAKDLSEPWFPQQKSSASARQTKHTGKSKVIEDSAENTVMKKSSKRGRGRGKAIAEQVDQAKRRTKRKHLPLSTADVVLALSKTSIPNVDELRLKREEDALACGRIVRSVASHLQHKDFQKPVTMCSSGGERIGAPPCVLASRAFACPQLSSGLPQSTEENNEVGVDGSLFLEEGRDNIEPVFCRRPGKEPIPDDCDDAVAHGPTLASTDHVKDGYLNIDIDTECEEQYAEPWGRFERRNPSPVHENDYDWYGSREFCHSQLPKHGCGQTSKPRLLLQSIERSSRQNYERSNQRPRSCSPRQRYNSSPKPHREDGDGMSHRSGREYYTEDDFPDQQSTGNRNSMRLLMNESRLRRSYDSSRNNNWHARSSSRGEGRQLPRTSTTTDPSKSARMMSKNGTESMEREWVVSLSAKEELNMVTSSAMDRKQRRKNQALLDLEKDRRQREGKKPFYLTLNDEGKPYGPGKPAWMAEINKLASGLDPSCTHVRKQTFEDVQTFKKRLDEKFDYSGTLNDDFLRALMGKAVTKRRGELIALIRRGGAQPKHINENVWGRLEKLSSSKQREEKSEQGRYANACRRSLGRTGSIGINGIRENLRTQFGRSPDLDEILEEMHRDKGYGGRKRKVRPMSLKKERSLVELLLSDEGSRSESFGKFSEQDSSDRSVRSHYSRHRRNLHESTGMGREYGIHQMDDCNGRNGIGQKNYTVSEKNRLSKDEYIRRLEGEILKLQEEKVNVFASNTGTQAVSPMSTGCSSRE